MEAVVALGAVEVEDTLAKPIVSVAPTTYEVRRGFVGGAVDAFGVADEARSPGGFDALAAVVGSDGEDLGRGAGS